MIMFLKFLKCLNSLNTCETKSYLGLENKYNHKN